MLVSRDSSAMRYEGSAVWGDATRASPNRRGQPNVGCADGGDAVTCRRIRGVSGLRAAPSIVTPREMASNMTSPWWCPSYSRWCCMFGIKYIMGQTFHPSLSNTPFFSSHIHTHSHLHTSHTQPPPQHHQLEQLRCQTQIINTKIHYLIHFLDPLISNTH